MSSLPGLPRVVFVLGKGGVGRTSVSAALATSLAQRGERVLVFEWAISDAVAPWYGLPPAGIAPVEISPGVSVANFALDDALRAFFVDHLKVRSFYRHVVAAGPLRRLVLAAPGIAEMMFLGHVCWLTTLAAEEAGLRFDRVVVDAPATGHGASLLDLASTLTSMHATGLMAAEITRVDRMMRDPGWTGAVVVSLPEELAVDETLELVPRATASLGRAPLALVVNRSVRRLVRDEPEPAWWHQLAGRLPPAVSGDLRHVHELLRQRLRFEQRLEALGRGLALGTASLDEQLSAGTDGSPRAVVASLAAALGGERLGGAT